MIYMIKGIVFDMDHTLFDRYATIEECAPVFYENFKSHLAPGLGIEDVAVTMIYADKNYVHLGWDTACRYLNESGFFREPMGSEEYSACLVNAFFQVAVPFKFTYDVLEDLINKGYKLGLITNGFNKELQQAKIDMLGIEKYFDEIIICVDDEMKKPNTLPFEIMADKLGLNPCELMYVGDNPKNDVDASRRAGYTPVWVRTTGSWVFEDIEKCRYQIDDISQLKDIL